MRSEHSYMRKIIANNILELPLLLILNPTSIENFQKGLLIELLKE